MADMEFAPPKYAQIVAALREGIEDGTYPPGSMLPSESQLVREFGASRTTVVRALQVLRLQGWIEREHGRGSFVKGPPGRGAGRARAGRTVLEAPEVAERQTVTRTGRAAVPEHVAALLEVPPGSPALVRQRVTKHEGVPSELISAWFPVDVAEGTDLGSPEPLRAGMRQHLHAVKHLRFDHIAERVAARLPEEDEAKLLEIDERTPVLNLLVTAYDAADRPLEVVDVVLPGDQHELDDVYPADE